MANPQRVEDDSKHVKTAAQVTALAGDVEPATNGSSSAAAAGAGAAAVASSCTIPSFAAASELLSAPYSCLVMNAHRRHISLPPVFLNKKRTGIQEELQAELLKFSESLKGVPLAYDNIRIVGHQGDIYDDSGYVHMNILANFIVFQPKTGQKLLGRVNKLAASHVGCLVHGCFNASIPRPHLVPMETWRDSGPQIGAELEFQVTALDTDSVGVLLIRGQLDRTRVQELLALSENPASAVSVHQGAAAEAEPDPVAGSEPALEAAVDTPKKRKRAKVRIKEEMPDGQVAVTVTPPEPDEVTGDTNGDDAGGERRKKKKKKKEKEVKEEEEEVQVAAAERHASDSSGYNSDKPSRKRRRDADADGLSEESPKSTKTKKKRRKSETEQLA